MSAFDNRSAIIAGYDESRLDLARRLQQNPTMRLQVSGFFDDRSADRLGMERDATLIGTLGDVSKYVKDHGIVEHFTSVPWSFTYLETSPSVPIRVASRSMPSRSALRSSSPETWRRIVGFCCSRLARSRLLSL